jgi:phage gp36-like protein
MAYVTQAEIEARIPAPLLRAALDDDRDGQADQNLLTTIISLAAQAVDGLVSGSYEVPFDDPAPPVIRDAAFAFACEMIHDRRRVEGERNPYKTLADSFRARLEKVGNGEIPLSVATVPATSSGAAVTETSALDDSLR